MHVYRKSVSFIDSIIIIYNITKEIGFEVYGGDNAPYIWVKMKDKKSWEAFYYLLDKANIVTTPGVGFGLEGEGFLRFSAFGHREDIKEAAYRLKRHLK